MKDDCKDLLACCIMTVIFTAIGYWAGKTITEEQWIDKLKKQGIPTELIKKMQDGNQ